MKKPAIAIRVDFKASKAECIGTLKAGEGLTPEGLAFTSPKSLFER